MIDQQPSPRVDRRLLIAGAGLAGVLLGFVLLVTVFGGKSDQQAVGLPPRTPLQAVPEPPVPDTSPPSVELPSALADGRDPFVQVVTVPKGAQPGQGPPPAQGSAQGPLASTQPTRSPGGTSGNASLELKSILPDGAGVTRANISVDGQSHSPASGEVFSYGVRLERIDGNCVEVSAQGARARMCLPVAKP
jgi:hypothetical protein